MLILKIPFANLCKQIYDIINCPTSICPFESEKCGKEGKKLQKFEKSLERKELFRWNIKKEAVSPDINHTLNLLITPKGRQEPSTKVQSQYPAEQISRIWFFSKIHFLSTLGSVANPQLLFHLYLFGGTGMNRSPHFPKHWLVSFVYSHCFNPKMTILKFSCSFWAFYPNRHSPPVKFILETLGKTMICINHWE